MAIILPSAVQAAAQIPLNTFSPTSSPLFNTVNGLTYNYDPALGVWTSAATGSGLAAASLAEAAAGVLTSVYSSPQTSVPKDASGMTGSALIPAGNTAARPAATSYTGAFRYNTQTANLEFSDGTNWIPLLSFSTSTSVGLGLAISGTDSDILKLSVPSANIAPAAGLSISGSINGSLYYDDEYGAIFMRYFDGATVQWVQVVGAGGGTTKLMFPPGPVNGQTYTGGNGVTYTYNATKGVWAAGGGGSGTWQTFTASGTWTKPSGVSTVYVYAVGGGGGGGGGGAGGGGAGIFRMVDASTVPASVAVTIGSGGAFGGGGGGTSSVGSFISAPGGTGGGSSGPTTGGRGGGIAFTNGGAGAYSYQSGGQSFQVGATSGGAFTGGGGGTFQSGAGSWFGGGGGGGTAGGPSAFAGSGSTGAGSIPGGGGGGGAGARGQVSIMAF